MSRFDLYRGAGGQGYIIDLQSDFLESYTSRIAAPVVPLVAFSTPAKNLNPIVEIAGEKHVILTHFLSAIPASDLRHHIGNLSEQADEITRALDLLFQGY